MKSALNKDIIREIKRTKNRFISIMVIIALGAGFFVGVKATAPSMEKTAEDYFEETGLMDFKVLSTFGFDDNDVAEIIKIEGVEKVMPSYSIDLVTSATDGESQVIKAMALPKGYVDIPEEEPETETVEETTEDASEENSETEAENTENTDTEEAEDITYDEINVPELVEGRLPEAKNECLAENGSGYKLGDEITFDEMSGDTVVSDVLSDNTYTVVGLVDSSLYVYYDHGTSSVGNGSISTYIMVPYENFLYTRYTEVYVKTTDSEKFGAFTQEYQDSLKPIADSLVALGSERYDIFYTTTMAQINDAQKEFDSKSEEAATQLSEAQTQLEEARTQIADALKELEDGQAEYESQKILTEEQFKAAEKQIADAKAQLAAGQINLENGIKEYEAGVTSYQNETAAARATLDAGWQQYNEGVAQLNAAIAQLNQGQIEYENGLTEYNQGEAEYANGVLELENGKQQIEDGQEEIDTAVSSRDALLAIIPYENMSDSMKTQIDSYNQQIEEGQAQLDAARIQVAEGEQELALARAELDAAKLQLEEAEAQLNEGRAQISASQTELEAAKSQLDAGELELSQKSAVAQAQLDAAYAEVVSGRLELMQGNTQVSNAESQLQTKKLEANIQFDDAEEELEEGYEQLEEAQSQLTEGEAEYAEAVENAESQLNDGAERIQNARQQIGDITSGIWYAFTRDDNPGYSNLQADTGRIDAMASVFPVFFFIVAALVCLTTMSRMVEEQRGQMGTLKALGYSTKKIAGKYFIYATFAGAVGCIIGIFIGILFMPTVIFTAYSAMYSLPALSTVIPWGALAGAIVLSFISTSLVSMAACYKELRAEAAVLMRPKTPKAGKRILLERIKPLWSRMKFSHKVTSRNLFRYKARMLMTVFGIAGCTALIVSGYGLQDAIGVIVPKQFNSIAQYDAIVSLKVTGDMNDFADLAENLEEEDRVDSYMFTRQEELEATNIGRTETVTTYIFVPQTKELFGEFLRLHERDDENLYTLDDDGVIITEKMASNLGLSVGEYICFTIGETEYKAEISAIAENYVYHYIYMSPDLYEEITGNVAQFNSILLKENNLSAEEEKGLSEDLLVDKRLVAVQFVTDIVAEFNETITSLNAVVIIMILAAGALAFVVLYNLTNINIAERVREIATIKVLGFYNNEVNMYIIRENIVLTIIGIFAGTFAGTFLSRFMVLTIEMDEVMFGRDIDFSSFLLAAGLTALFSLLVNLVMSRKMKKISMVESLKSIE